MRLPYTLISGLGAITLASSAAAQTFTNYWSFKDDLTGMTVAGTISGLSNGDNLAPVGLSATVTEAPYRELLLTYNYLSSGNSAGLFNYYSAKDGIITSSNFFLVSLPTNSGVFFVVNTNAPSSYPLIRDGSGGHLAYSKSAGTVFAANNAVPEPATWAMMIAGAGAIGFAMRRRRKNVTTTVAYAA